MRNNKIILSINNITKKFGGVIALSNVSFNICEGECHAIVGENGAGKTTLLNILSGAIYPDEGYFEFRGKKFDRMNPKESIDLGLSIIHQDLALVETMTVMENVFLPHLEGKFAGFVKNQKELISKTKEILILLGGEINPLDSVENLSMSKKQIVEIAKALAYETKLIIMDEPTASLTKAESEKLFVLISFLKKQGISIIFVSHRLEEVFKISDRVTILRDGKYVQTASTNEVKINDVIKMMVGREVELYKRLNSETTKNMNEQDISLEIVDFTNKPYFENINFSVRKGEIFCLTGLVGSGRTELMQSIFGIIKPESGKIKVFGKIARINSPKDAMKLGIGLLPEDRKLSGIINTMTVRENTSIAILPNIARFNLIKRNTENEITDKFIKLLNIKTPSMETNINNLSGGNQQKVILARWLATKVKILIVDEPTQGIDVGAKSEIHKILKDLSEQGVSIIIVSSDLPEVLSISDRLIVMKEGRIKGELRSNVATEEKIMMLAAIS